MSCSLACAAPDEEIKECTCGTPSLASYRNTHAAIACVTRSDRSRFTYRCRTRRHTRPEAGVSRPNTRTGWLLSVRPPTRPLGNWCARTSRFNLVLVAPPPGGSRRSPRTSQSLLARSLFEAQRLATLARHLVCPGLHRARWLGPRPDAPRLGLRRRRAIPLRCSRRTASHRCGPCQARSLCGPDRTALALVVIECLAHRLPFS